MALKNNNNNNIIVMGDFSSMVEVIITEKLQVGAGKTNYSRNVCLNSWKTEFLKYKKKSKWKEYGTTDRYKLITFFLKSV